MDADQVLAYRFARSGLTARRARDLADAVACPASDFSRDAALLAVGARVEDLTRDAYLDAVDRGDLVVGYVIRGAIHALAPDDHALYGRALISDDDAELLAQLGEQMKRLAREHGFAPTEALAEVSAATEDALANDTALDKNALHEALRQRVSAHLMPWCQGCQSHHVASMLWRYATVRSGVRLDAQRRYRLGRRDNDAPRPSDAARRFLHFYGPAKPNDFAEWAGIAKPHAQRLWDEIEPELTTVGNAMLLTEDLAELDAPPTAEGIRLLPPGDPYLQKPNRPLLAPEPEVRKRLFRPVASPGAVIRDGRLAGLWKARAKGRKTEITVEPLDGRLPKSALEDEAQRVAALRGSAEAIVVLA